MSDTIDYATPLELAREARALIADENHWIQHVSAARGRVDSASGGQIRVTRQVMLAVAPGDKEATCFCSSGAVIHQARIKGIVEFNNSGDDLVSQVIKLLDALDPEPGRPERRHLSDEPIGDIVTYNDTHTHAEVMAVWDQAIGVLEFLDLAQREEEED